MDQSTTAFWINRIQEEARADERARIAEELKAVIAAMPISPDPRVNATDEDWRILLRGFIERNLGGTSGDG